MAGSGALWQARLLFAHCILRQRHDGMSTREDDDMHGHARRVHAPWSGLQVCEFQSTTVALTAQQAQHGRRGTVSSGQGRSAGGRAEGRSMRTPVTHNCLCGRQSHTTVFSNLVSILFQTRAAQGCTQRSTGGHTDRTASRASLKAAWPALATLPHVHKHRRASAVPPLRIALSSGACSSGACSKRRARTRARKQVSV